MIITVLAYKSDSVDICCGCVLARYTSDFKWKSSMDRGIIVEFLAGLLFDNKHLDTGESGYEITFLFNGEEYNDVDWDLDALKKELMLEATALYEKRMNDFQRKEAEAKQQKDTEERERQQKDTEERERQQLAMLQAKYPKGTIL
jgi:hypothetical protein